MTLLALDLATSTGWCLGDEKGKILDSGSFVLEGDDCEKLAMLFSNLAHLGETHTIGTVVIEKPLFLARHNAAFLMCLRGVAMAAAGLWVAEFHEYAPVTVKKAVTGSGKATKETVRKFVTSITGVEPKNDDESDSIAVYLTWWNRNGRRSKKWKQ